MTKTISISIQTAPEVIAFARQNYKAHGYFSALDYLNAIFNTAAMHEF